MAKKASKGTNGYVAKINKMLKEEFGTIPAKLDSLIHKTAMDMLILERIGDQLSGMDDFLGLETGSTGQQKIIVTPLLPYYDKASARVTDDLYNLGLTARKQAAKGDDSGDKKVTDNIGSLLAEMRG